ncbi:MAG TPA: hypothetical protein VGD56_21935 [Gemmatirosa sp.]
MFGALLGLWGALILIGQWLALTVAIWVSPGGALLLWSVPTAFVVVVLRQWRVRVAPRSVVRQWAGLQVGLLAVAPGYFSLAKRGWRPDVLMSTAILVTSASTLWIGGSLWRATTRFRRNLDAARASS